MRLCPQTNIVSRKSYVSAQWSARARSSYFNVSRVEHSQDLTHGSSWEVRKLGKACTSRRATTCSISFDENRRLWKIPFICCSTLLEKHRTRNSARCTRLQQIEHVSFEPFSQVSNQSGRRCLVCQLEKLHWVCHQWGPMHTPWYTIYNQ